MKLTLRRQLKELCFQEGLFEGKDIEPALEWRLYQLQRNRAAESRKVKPSQSSLTHSFKAFTFTKLVTAIESVDECASASGTSDAAVKVSHYDPVRDL